MDQIPGPPTSYTKSTPSSDPDVARSMVTLFPTLTVNHLCQDVEPMNDALRALILTLAAEQPSVDTSNIGGFHSGPDFINREEPCVAELRARLRDVIVELTKLVLRPTAGERKIHFELQGWANLLRQGDYHGVHSHPSYFWSGVYYVTGNGEAAEHPLSGKLELIDPRAGASIADPRETTLYGRYLVDPVPGQLIVFPSWLTHCVHPYRGEGERISIGFNVNFELRAS